MIVNFFLIKSERNIKYKNGKKIDVILHGKKSHLNRLSFCAKY